MSLPQTLLVLVGCTTMFPWAPIEAAKAAAPDPCDQVPLLHTWLSHNVDTAECPSPSNPGKTTYYGGRGYSGSIRTSCSEAGYTCKRKCKAGFSCSCGQDYEIGEELEICIEGSSGWFSSGICYTFSATYPCTADDCERCKFYACMKTATKTWDCTTTITGSYSPSRTTTSRTTTQKKQIDGVTKRCKWDPTCGAHCCNSTTTTTLSTTTATTQSTSQASTNAPSTASTTGSPMYSTTDPISTTGSPIYTTGSPIYTTGSPIYTTGSPIYTTGSPVYATSDPISTTESPIYTTGSPVYTTGSPGYATSDPISTTGSPIYTTGSPIYTTGSPNSPPTAATTQEPESDSTPYRQRRENVAVRGRVLRQVSSTASPSAPPTPLLKSIVTLEEDGGYNSSDIDVVLRMCSMQYHLRAQLESDPTIALGVVHVVPAATPSSAGVEFHVEAYGELSSRCSEFTFSDSSDAPTPAPTT